MREAVNLTRVTTRKADGRTYTYWVLRWFAANGRQCSKSIGRVGPMSRRRAEKLRRAKQSELERCPQRRSGTRPMPLGEYLATYFRNRQSELAPGTLALHRQTARYLKGFLGEQRRLEAVERPDARAFKAALASGELAYLNKRRRIMSEATVNLNLRNARRMFGVAVEDGLLPANPFDRIAGRNPPPKGWHEVSGEEFSRLLAAAPPAWRVLLALTRYACLRRGEALNLRWESIDWQRSRLTVIANEEWRPKDRDSRTVPVSPELRELLLDAFARAAPGQQTAIPAGSVAARNISRDFTVLCRRAGISRYAKPLHTLRKTGLTDWARRFPAHVVAAWAGHASIETTQEFYLKVSESDYDRAAAASPSSAPPAVPLPPEPAAART